MNRPPLEVADLVRAAGRSFIERSRRWITWQHIKVLRAIVRCRTAALGGHRDRCTRCGYRPATASIRYMAHNDVNSLSSLVSELHELHDAFPENNVIARELLVSFSHSIGGYGMVGQLDVVDSLVNELRSTYESLPKETILTDAFSAGLFNAGFAFSNVGDLTKAESFLEELENVYDTSGKYHPIGIRIAKTLSDMIFACMKVSTTEKIRELLDKLEFLDRSDPQVIELGFWYAQGLLNAIEANKKMGYPSASLEKEYADLNKRRPDIIGQFESRRPKR